ncbi:MAG: hypothetical protein NT062_10065 [Proteobacteria bacterium]|nr:hypothetical protein [Pseudomonadota bacterium]
MNGNEDGSVDVDVSDDSDTVTITRSQYNAELAKARRAGEGRSARREDGASTAKAASSSGGSFSFEQVRELVGMIGASRSEPASSAARPAASSTSPARVNSITAGGLVDIWNLRDDEIAQLGPQGMREQFEKLVAAGNKAAGAPDRPTLPTGRKR